MTGMSETDGARTQTNTQTRTRTDAHGNTTGQEIRARRTKDTSTKQNAHNPNNRRNLIPTKMARKSNSLQPSFSRQPTIHQLRFKNCIRTNQHDSTTDSESRSDIFTRKSLTWLEPKCRVEFAFLSMRIFRSQASQPSQHLQIVRPKIDDMLMCSKGSHSASYSTIHVDCEYASI